VDADGNCLLDPPLTWPTPQMSKPNNSPAITLHARTTFIHVSPPTVGGRGPSSLVVPCVFLAFELADPGAWGMLARPNTTDQISSRDRQPSYVVVVSILTFSVGIALKACHHVQPPPPRLFGLPPGWSCRMRSKAQNSFSSNKIWLRWSTHKSTHNHTLAPLIHFHTKQMVKMGRQGPVSGPPPRS